MAKTYSDLTFGGTLTTTSQTLTTVAENTVYVIKGFLISNANAADKKAELIINNVRVVPFVKSIATGDTLKSELNIPLLPGQSIKIRGEVDTDMDYYIWGTLETSV